MNKNWIINASPIILLGKAELLKTISPLAETWIIPEGVIQEVQKIHPTIAIFRQGLKKMEN